MKIQGMSDLPLALLIGAAVTLAACDNQTEAQAEIEEQAEAIEDSYDAEAAIVESLAEGAPEQAQAVAEKKADALRAEGDAEKKHLEAMSNELDEVPAR